MAIADAVFSVSGTNATHTQFDKSTALYPMATATLSVVDSFLAETTANSTVDLYMIVDDIDGTSDVTAPTTTDKQGAKYVGSFPIYATATAQYQQINISLAGAKKCRFSIQKNTGTTINFTSGNTGKIEGFTYGPAA